MQTAKGYQHNTFKIELARRTIVRALATVSGNTMIPKTIFPRELGKPMTRVDGRLKVTGAARYAAEFGPSGALFAYALKSSIANGRIASIDTAAAQLAPGVRLVLTHLNAMKLKKPKPDKAGGGGIQNELRMPLSDDEIYYAGQYVALLLLRHWSRHVTART